MSINIYNRYLFKQIRTDLNEKMVFLGGPRQVGKTTLAKAIAQEWQGGSTYLNWDRDQDRLKILQGQFAPSGLVIFDEIHKNRRWRNLIKGLFDHLHPTVKFLITGSARLDFYRFGGDSLQGRYHYLRMHPLSVRELKLSSQAEMEQLLELGGFPEPYFSGSKTKARRWSRSYRQRLVREDLAQLERTEDLTGVELMTMRLPGLVGSCLSLNSLREDLQVSYATAKKWFEILERLYHVFRVIPFGSPKIKAVKKEFKHYHYDWSLIDDPGDRFENFIASHLLKLCHWTEDTEGIDMELRYVRDIEKREVDFAVIKQGKPILFVEAKKSDTTPAASLKYIKAKFPKQRCIQVVQQDGVNFISKDGVEVKSALNFLSELDV